ncbi:MAG: acireductone synthase [Phycisphaerae bacterium]
MPLQFDGRGILLDIEGTTSPIAFVYDVMFPYVRQHLATFLQSHFDDDQTRAACDQIARDAGHASLNDWLPQADRAALMVAVKDEVTRLMDGDVKATGLKSLQGLIWKDGFTSGEMKARVFADVVEALRRWASQGRDVRIYSSGSITAQKLFFGYSEHGDLLSYFRDHFDTTTGPKREVRSYELIRESFELPAESILFLSDVVAELDAARSAGMHTGLVVRPGNPAVEDDHTHPVLTSFDGL